MTAQTAGSPATGCRPRTGLSASHRQTSAPRAGSERAAAHPTTKSRPSRPPPVTTRVPSGETSTCPTYPPRPCVPHTREAIVVGSGVDGGEGAGPPGASPPAGSYSASSTVAPSQAARKSSRRLGNAAIARGLSDSADHGPGHATAAPRSLRAVKPEAVTSNVIVTRPRFGIRFAGHFVRISVVPRFILRRVSP